MITMKKILVSISMICYLSVSGISAACAFPMLHNSPDSDTISFTQVNTGEGMTCHKNTADSDATKTSIDCEIFCAAFTLAFVDSVQTIFLPISLSEGMSSKIDDLATRQISVELHPPK